MRKCQVCRVCTQGLDHTKHSASNSTTSASVMNPEEGGAKEGEEHVVRGQLGAGRPGAALADDEGRAAGG